MIMDMASPMRVLPPPAPTLGGRIKQARRYDNLSQEALAEELDSARETISNWERGETSPPVNALITIARVTRFPAAWFVDGLDLDDDPDDGGRINGKSSSACTSSDATILAFPERVEQVAA